MTEQQSSQTEQRRRRRTNGAEFDGRREATHTDVSDRNHERLCDLVPFMIPIRSVGVSRPATQAGPSNVVIRSRSSQVLRITRYSPFVLR